jgi:hypothetical protein
MKLYILQIEKLFYVDDLHVVVNSPDMSSLLCCSVSQL